MYRGVGPPALVWKGQVIIFPPPLKGGRKEKYESLTKTYENIDGELIPGDQSWRFKAGYSFGKVQQSFIDTVIAIQNATAVVPWIPHSDFPPIKYDVLITVEDATVDGNIYLDSLIINVISTNRILKKPSIDNIIGGMLLTRIGVIGG